MSRRTTRNKKSSSNYILIAIGVSLVVCILYGFKQMKCVEGKGIRIPRKKRPFDKDLLKKREKELRRNHESLIYEE